MQQLGPHPGLLNINLHFAHTESQVVCTGVNQRRPLGEQPLSGGSWKEHLSSVLGNRGQVVDFRDRETGGGPYRKPGK